MQVPFRDWYTSSISSEPGFRSRSRCLLTRRLTRHIVGRRAAPLGAGGVQRSLRRDREAQAHEHTGEATASRDAGNRLQNRKCTSLRALEQCSTLFYDLTAW
eukprot:3189400-Pleurochrysis_carterae.AAC.3